MYKTHKISIKSDVIGLRKKGFSYTEIQRYIHLPKSTLSRWLKSVSLSEIQRKKLEVRRRMAGQRGAQNRKLTTAKKIEKIKTTSAQDIKVISKRELWLMGIMLYWRERLLNGNMHDSQRGVRFTSSDPDLIQFFLKWLVAVGGLAIDDIQFDIFVSEERKNLTDPIISYWSEVTQVPRSRFTHVYIQKNHVKNQPDLTSVKQRKSKKSRYGFLRIRVAASSLLARQIAGWIAGIQKNY